MTGSLIRALDEPERCSCHDNPPRAPGQPDSWALVVSHHGKGYLLDYFGPAIEYEVECDAAITLTEGTFHSNGEVLEGALVVRGHMNAWTNYLGEHDHEFYVDDVRPVTAEEWAAWCDTQEQPWPAELAERYYTWVRPACMVHGR